MYVRVELGHAQIGPQFGRTYWRWKKWWFPDKDEEVVATYSKFITQTKQKTDHSI